MLQYVNTNVFQYYVKKIKNKVTIFRVVFRKIRNSKIQFMQFIIDKLST